MVSPNNMLPPPPLKELSVQLFCKVIIESVANPLVEEFCPIENFSMATSPPLQFHELACSEDRGVEIWQVNGEYKNNTIMAHTDL